MEIKNILIYCGASAGFNEIHKKAAQELGALFAQKGIRLIYGAGSVGLMGIVADAVLENGGEVTGVIPTFMKKWEVQHKGLSECIEVETMHERKQIMAEKADAVIALSGGFGTLDELFEILTWKQLGLHTMPVGMLNINGFYDSLLQMMHKMIDEGFLKESNKDMFVVAESVEELLEKLTTNATDTQKIDKWIGRA